MHQSELGVKEQCTMGMQVGISSITRGYRSTSVCARAAVGRNNLQIHGVDLFIIAIIIGSCGGGGRLSNR
eukprot:8013160-Prorocentrum_lima.AAC.1